MFSQAISKKTLFFSLFISSLIILIKFVAVFFDNKTLFVFCDVGQGDATYIRTRNQADILIDAGPDKRVLGCLGKYMPFYDRTIELIIISHPQQDHFGNLPEILKRYQVNKIITASPTLLQKKIKAEITNLLVQASSGQKFFLNGGELIFYWPEHDFIGDENSLSLVFTFKENNFKVLFAGDATAYILSQIITDPKNAHLGPVNILKIPHHGSKNGLTSSFLKLANPSLAIISVGKKNNYGHPSPQILDLLKASKVELRRTDKEGDIVFKLPN